MYFYLVDSPRQLRDTAVLFLICLLFFDFSTLDIDIQQYFYQASNQLWLWPKKEPLARLFLYDGIKYLLIGFGIFLLTMLAAKSWLPWQTIEKRRFAIVLLSLALIPLIVGGLKTLTNIPCPHSIDEFGGSYPYLGVLEHLREGRVFWSGQRCFPAAHASSGFALFSLMAFFNTPKSQLRAFYFALALGWIMGIYKMIIGDHFLSHTLASMLLSWWIFHLVIVIDKLFFTKVALNPVDL